MMTVILDNLEPEMLEKLANLANTHGRTLTKEIKVILMNEVQKTQIETRYNAWGKLVTKQSIQSTINEIKELRKGMEIDKNDIQEMREKGRRF